jgi:hypothetical protein
VAGTVDAATDPMAGDRSATRPSSAMAADERSLLRHCLARCHRYLEFGSGLSTFFALDEGVEMCWSVELDPRWVERMRSFLDIRKAEAAGRLVLHYADIGAVGEWGIPFSDSPQAKWNRYPLEIWDRIPAPPDLVFVDGRFRLACCLAAWLACPRSTRVLMHDFGTSDPVRRNYARVQCFAEIVGVTKTLALLRRRRDFSPARALAMLERALADPW